MTHSRSHHHAEQPGAVLALLLDEVRGLLGSRLVGAYLHGSLALGAFDPESSDVDLLVVTTAALPRSQLPALAALHACVAGSGLPLADELEVSYMPRTAVRRYDPRDAHHPSIGNDWPFGLERHDNSWVINLRVLRERGVVVYGPPPRTLIDPISDDELRRAVSSVVEDFWARQQSNPEWLATRKYQGYAVLTMCRALYTLEYGQTVSKPAAAAWARDALGRQWVGVLRRAEEWRAHRDSTRHDPAETVRFLRFALERSRSAHAVNTRSCVP